MFNETIEGLKVIDLIGTEEEKIQNAWGEIRIDYKNLDLFDFYEENLDKIKDYLNKIKISNYKDNEFQEVYLGYDTKKDVFVSGFDWWYVEEYNDEEYNRFGSVTLRFKIQKSITFN